MAVALPFNTPVMVVDTVMAGVLVAVATVPAKPFAEATETDVTVPDVAGGCHVAAVLLVAVSICPDEGAVALLTFTVVVALARASVIPEVSPAAVPVTCVMTPDAGVPKAGATNVGPLEKTTFVVPVVPLTVVPWMAATVEATLPGPVAVTSLVRAVIAPAYEGLANTSQEVPFDS